MTLSEIYRARAASLAELAKSAVRYSIRNDLKEWRSYMSVWLKDSRGQSAYIKRRPKLDGTVEDRSYKFKNPKAPAATRAI